jgi:hypothetical protein
VVERERDDWETRSREDAAARKMPAAVMRPARFAINAQDLGHKVPESKCLGITVYSSVGSAIRTTLATDGAKNQHQTKYQIKNLGYLLVCARVLEMPIAKGAVCCLVNRTVIALL